jgi:hypothetical protein
MPRTYLIFGDIEGKLDVLRVECRKCRRKGRHQVHKLIAKSWPQGEHDEMEGTTERLPSAMHTACTSAATCAAPICRRCCDGPGRRVLPTNARWALGAGAAVASTPGGGH